MFEHDHRHTLDFDQHAWAREVRTRNQCQKKGKKRMRQFGKVDIPQEAFIAALKVDV